MISRREIVLGGTGAAAVIWLARLMDGALAQATSLGKFEIVKSDEEWRRELTSEQYAVLRRHETENPWTSPLNKEYRPGTYLCAGCGLPLFSSPVQPDEHEPADDHQPLRKPSRACFQRWPSADRAPLLHEWCCA